MIKTDLAQHAERLREAREPFVVATVVRAAAPTSVKPGDSAVVRADGAVEGFVGGVCAQASVRLHAVRAMETGDALLLRLVPGSASAEDDPLAQDGVVVVNNPCLSGGALEIFLEPQLPAPRMVVAGGTPIARALATLADAAGYHVLPCQPGEVQPLTTDAAVVIASHGHDEELALVRALEAGVGYVGLVASPRRGAAVRESLAVPDALRAEIHSPAGLDIGARTPAEVAVSILAEIVAQREAGHAAEKPTALAVHRSPATAVDPVCGMEVVAAQETVHLDAGGERHYFCCEGCRATFAAQRGVVDPG